MTQVSRFLRKITDGYAHWCPGCKCLHGINVEKPRNNGAIWKFSQNFTAPTFEPSVKISAHDPTDGYKEICHYWLREGKLSYLPDSTHEYAGITIDLPPLPMEYCDMQNG